MQSLDDKLTEVYDRGLREGIESLTLIERDLFLTQDFIIEFEMNGLSGYFYNRLPDIEGIQKTVLAMRNLGAGTLAALVGEAAEIFRDYKAPVTSSTWSEALAEYDPGGSLQTLETKIHRLSNYGFPDER